MKVIERLKNNPSLVGIEKDQIGVGVKMMSDPVNTLHTIKDTAEFISDEGMLPISKQLIDSVMTDENIQEIGKISDTFKAKGFDENYLKDSVHKIRDGRYQEVFKNTVEMGKSFER